VLEEGALFDQLLEPLARQEGVVRVRFLVRPRLPRGAGDGVLDVLVELENPLDQGVLADARRS
jgi:hypothetical protein